jgi:DNA-binding response OmpR family regulator
MYTMITKGATLARPPPPLGKSQDNRAFQNGSQSKIGIILLILDEPIDASAIVRALKARGLRPAIMPGVEDVKEIVSNWQPQAVILQAGRVGWLMLLRLLDDRDIPCVLMGTTEQLRRAVRQGSGCVQLLLPVEPEEIAEGVQLVIGPPSSGGRPDAIDLGIVKIDLRARTVEVEGQRKALPPKEFEILVQLALQEGAPLNSTELLGRLWPRSTSATVNDVYTRIWRLRRMIGDYDRRRPLIVNRRGFGYMLDIAEPEVE